MYFTNFITKRVGTDTISFLSVYNLKARVYYIIQNELLQLFVLRKSKLLFYCAQIANINNYQDFKLVGYQLLMGYFFQSYNEKPISQ